MNRVYLDSSVILAILLRERTAKLSLEKDEFLITSEITDLECRRTLDRIRIEEKLKTEELGYRLAELDAILKATRIIQLSTAVLKKAKGPFPTVVRSLDAIHLATAQLAGASTLLSLDKQQIAAARAIDIREGSC